MPTATTLPQGLNGQYTKSGYTRRGSLENDNPRFSGESTVLGDDMDEDKDGLQIESEDPAVIYNDREGSDGGNNVHLVHSFSGRENTAMESSTHAGLDTQDAGKAHRWNWAADASRIAAKSAMSRQNKRTSIHKPARQKTKGRIRLGSKSGIKLDTSVSRHRGAPPRQVFPQAFSANGSGTGNKSVGAMGFVTLSDLQASDTASPKGSWWQRARAGRSGQNGSKESLHTRNGSLASDHLAEQSRSAAPSDNGFRFKSKTLRSQMRSKHDIPILISPSADPAEERNVQKAPDMRPGATNLHPSQNTSLLEAHRSPIDISPSDRPITIGFSWPPESVSGDEVSPGSGYVERRIAAFPTVTRARSNDEDAVPPTPTIIITPAREHSDWSLAPSDSESEYRPRPASSVYSQSTYRWTQYTENNAVPPVPALPAHYRGRNPDAREVEVAEKGRDRSDTIESNVTDFEEDDESRRKERIMSSMTVFEEDETPRTATTTKAAQGLNDLKLDTSVIPTPRRSRGWWDTITTPFGVSRSSAWGASPTSADDKTPDVPLLTGNSLFSALEKPASYDTDFLNNAFGIAPHKEPSSAHPENTVSPTSAAVPFSIDHASFSDADQTPKIQSTFSWDASTTRNTVASSQNTTRKSEYSLFSPHDREIPFVLGSDSDPPAPHPSNPFYTSAQHVDNSTRNAPHDEIKSPVSYDGDSTPVVATATLGTALAASPNIEDLNERNTMANKFSEPDSSEQLAFYPSQKVSQGHLRDDSAPRPVYTRESPISVPQATTKAYPSTPWPDQPRDAPTGRGHNSMDHSSSRNSHSKERAYISRGPRSGSPNSRPNRDHEGPRGSYPMSYVSRKTYHDYHHHDTAPRKKADVIINCFGRQKTTRKKKKCRCITCCLLFWLILIILAIALPLTLRHAGSSSHPVTPISTNGTIESQWLNLTGFPPIPTGQSTVIQVENTVAVSGCVAPSTFWSCDVPKDDQQALKPNQPNQPNFEFAIVFVNGTISNTSAVQPVPTKRSVPVASSPVAAGALIRGLRKIRDVFSDGSNPSPAVPSTEDQIFIGNTTDQNSEPFDGEVTPFFISFLAPTKASDMSARLAKRAGSSSTTSSSSTATTSDQFGQIASLVPDPSVNSDGTAAPADLLPLPSNQPLKLYNRGLATEHYGFYVYYDRSIFLKSIHFINNTAQGLVPADENGGATLDSAKFRCTWSQTRYLVQIWTSQGNGMSLLTPNATATASSSAASSTATDWSRPGSFPYPVTITIDRHGGTLKEKMIYCYEMDDRSKIIDDSELLQLEERSFSGQLVNPAGSPFSNTTSSTEDGGPGGIDGGTGGCQCEWANWARV